MDVAVDERDSSASAMGDPDSSQASCHYRGAREVSHPSVPAQNISRAPRDEEEDTISQVHRLVSHTKALPAMLKPLVTISVKERRKQSLPSSCLNQGALVGITFFHYGAAYEASHFPVPALSNARASRNRKEDIDTQEGGQVSVFTKALPAKPISLTNLIMVERKKQTHPPPG